MNSYITCLRPYQSAIILMAILLAFVGYVFQDGLVTVLAGFFFTAPLQVAILRNEKLGKGPLLRKIFYAESLHYALLCMLAWALPHILGLSVMVYFFADHFDNYRLMYFPAFLLYAFLFSFAAPELHNIATGQKGVRLPFWDVARIYLIWTAYGLLQGATTYAESIDKSVILLAAPMTFYAFALAFCLQAVVILRRNRESSGGFKD